MLFHEKGPVPDTFRRLIQALRGHAVPHVFVGEAALCAYGAIRMPTRFDVSVPAADIGRFRGEVAGRDFRDLPGQPHGWYDAMTNIEAHLLPAGAPVADRFRFPAIVWPDPGEAVELHGVPVPYPERLIEIALAGGSLDAVVACLPLTESPIFDAGVPNRLHPSVRGLWLERLMALNARGEERLRELMRDRK